MAWTLVDRSRDKWITLAGLSEFAVGTSASIIATTTTSFSISTPPNTHINRKNGRSKFFPYQLTFWSQSLVLLDHRRHTIAAPSSRPSIASNHSENARANFAEPPQKKQRSAALKIDWAQVTTSLGLRGQTAASLQAFKKRNDDVRRKVQQLSQQSTQVDFAHYRSVLKNQAIVDEIEKRFAAFKPATYDVSRQLKAIDAFEVEAVKNAEATKNQVDMTLKDLQKTLENIETARPFEDLTVVCGGISGLIITRVSVLILMWHFYYRMRLPLPSPRLTRRPPSWSPRAAGRCLDTRQVFSSFFHPVLNWFFD